MSYLVSHEGQRKAVGSSVLPAQWLPVHVTNRPDSQGTTLLLPQFFCWGNCRENFPSFPSSTAVPEPLLQHSLHQQGVWSCTSSPTEHPKTPLMPLPTAQQDTEGCSLQQGSCLLHFHPPPAPLLTHCCQSQHTVPPAICLLKNNPFCMLQTKSSSSRNYCFHNQRI